MVARHIRKDNNQSTLLVQTPGGFDSVSGDVIHIHHDSLHWLVCASLQGVVYLADSAHRPISPVVGQQLKQLFQSRIPVNGDLPVYIVLSAQQPNGSDCGVYVAAFAFRWATGTMAP